MNSEDIKPGDKYRRGEAYVEVLAVTADEIEWRIVSQGGSEKRKASRAEFKRREANSLAWGATFEPA